MNQDLGKYLLIAGLVIIITGAIIYFFHDKLHWLGRLPGDIRVEKENFRFYLPITTTIIFSILLSLIIAFIRRL